MYVWSALYLELDGNRWIRLLGPVVKILWRMVMVLYWSTVGTIIQLAEHPPWPEYLQIITLPPEASWVTLLPPFLVADSNSHCSSESTDSISLVAGLSLFNSSNQWHSQKKVVGGLIFSRLTRLSPFCVTSLDHKENLKWITEQTKRLLERSWRHGTFNYRDIFYTQTSTIPAATASKKISTTAFPFCKLNKDIRSLGKWAWSCSTR